MGVKPITRPTPLVAEDEAAPQVVPEVAPPAAPTGTPQHHDDLVRRLPGTWQDTPHGPAFVIEHRYDLVHSHGVVPLNTLLNLPGELLGQIGRNPELSTLDARRMLFFDTETTGLAGGTGTYVFLTGTGYIENDQFVVKQLFMPDLESERAVLHLFSEMLAGVDGLVSFNGRSFDWPLIEARFTMSRMRLRAAPPHLDLLSPARRVWKEQFESCSLGSLENEVLRFKRHGDVPGWLIPSLYFQYLRTRQLAGLLPVFEHNRHDVLSMLALAGHMAKLVHAPDELDLQSAEFYGLGRLYEDLGRLVESARLYERALRVANNPPIRALVLQRLTDLYRRLDQRHEALRICEDLTAGGTTLIFPYVELAKHYEHKARDVDSAEKMVLKALEVLRNPWNMIGQPAGVRADLDKRLRRLREKKARLEAIANKPPRSPKRSKAVAPVATPETYDEAPTEF